MNPRDMRRAKNLTRAIVGYQSKKGALPGLITSSHLDTIVAQFIDSLRRVEFAIHIRDAKLHPSRADPASDIFDPLRAAVLHNRQGQNDEAWWLVFIATHFGKHAVDGWRLSRDIYGKLGQGGLWDWSTTSQNPTAFHAWLTTNEATLRGGDGVSRRFSNHRKYESLKAASAKGTAQIFSSYINWIGPPQTHSDIVRGIHQISGQDPQAVFAALYRSMDVVSRFGRLGKFDFLAMLGKLGIAPIEPGSTFLKGATGPLAGARLLFGGNTAAKLDAKDLEARLAIFGQEIGLGSQVLEDAICNWQKSPATYINFRG